ncbi:uncharacterized protein LOC143301430 [Babylonia areolata]|uniref:uncharacterized protein LOC143301430 n=1 Tax=Babylonia areolata TaxID=304850 RepID=UPI003FD27D7A
MMTSYCVMTALLVPLVLLCFPECSAGTRERDRLIEEDVFYLVFRVQAGLNQSAYARYMDTNNANDDDDAIDLDFAIWYGCTSIDGRLPCDRHFRSRILDKWEHLPIEEVRVALYKDGVEVKYFLFNATNTSFTDWFNRARLLSGSYTDLKNAQYAYFSIEGEVKAARRFFIHKKFNGCGSDDGWMVIVDKPDPNCGETWEWEWNGGSYPTIIYCPSNTHCQFQPGTGSGAEKADLMTISVRMKSRCPSC